MTAKLMWINDSIGDFRTKFQTVEVIWEMPANRAAVSQTPVVLISLEGAQHGRTCCSRSCELDRY